jgi:hypothetical protein
VSESKKLGYYCLVLALAIGILLGSTWASRGQTLFGTNLFTPASRLTCIAFSILLAIILRNRVLSNRTLFFAASASLLLQLFTIAMTQMFGQSELFALGVVSASFEGAALCFSLFWFLSTVRTCDPRVMAGLVAGSFLVANIFDFIFIGVSPEIIVMQWVVSKGLVIALLSVLALMPKLAITAIAPPPPSSR